MNKIIKLLESGGNFRLYIAESTALVEKARLAHETTPVVTAALGRLLTATAMMGTMMKGEKDLITLSIKGDGELGGLVCTANSAGIVKGYPLNSYVDIPPKRKGKLDVARAIGNGSLNVIKDLGLKEPYNGSIDLVSGEIAEDLTYYFTASEQIPSSVGLGVLVDTDLSVKVAGGFILQVMPSCTEEALVQLEKNISKLSSVTSILEKDGLTGLLNVLADSFEMENLEELEPDFICDCSKEKVEKALITVGKEDLEKIAEEEDEIEMSCHFCNEKYYFSKEDLKGILNKI